jgi:flotillin
MTVVQMPESVFQVSLVDYEAYDSARLPFVVDITAFFRIANSDTAAQRVASFKELEHQLQGILQGVVRRIMSTNHLEEIMQQRSTLGNQFTEEVDGQLTEWGVQTVKMIEFMDLRDSAKQGSKVIQNIMAKEQARIDQESRVKVADHDRIAKLAEIEAKREVDLQAQQALQAVGIRSAQREQEVGIANEKSKQVVQEQAAATAVKEMEVLSINTVRKAEISKQAAEVKAEQDKNVAVVNAEQEKQVSIVKAEGEKTSTQTRAEGDLFASIKEAEGISAKGKAEGEAEKARLMAPVQAQIALADKIAGSDGYQKYLIDNRKVEADEAVGKAMASALENADLKIIGGNGGNIPGQAKGLVDMFTPSGGIDIAGMLTGFASTDEGRAVISKLLGEKS